MKYLNLGCGSRFHPDWTNIDFNSTGAHVIAHNLTDGIPFDDASFDVVYQSHILEHFRKVQAESFLRECCRVLRPQGVLRVVVPDLEQIAKNYIAALEKAILGEQEGAANYEWILLEMYDQTVRNYSGGEMAKYLDREDIPNEEFVLKRMGFEAKRLIEAGRQARKQIALVEITDHKAKRLFKHFYRFLRYPNYRRELLFRLLLGQEYDALQVGRFRQSGEVHYWMYDRYSLTVLLKKCGLENIVQRSATESYIQNWSNWNLDTEEDGTLYKPDSLFMEAIKPSI